MDPFARKMVLGAVAFGSVMVLMAGVLSVVYFHLHPQCNEQVLTQSLSPDKKWAATAMERRCGENGPFLLHVNLRAAEDPVRLDFFSGHASEGEVLLMEEETAAEVPELDWRSADQLIIRCSRCSSSFARTLNGHWQSVDIRYEAAR